MDQMQQQEMADQNQMDEEGAAYNQQDMEGQQNQEQ